MFFKRQCGGLGICNATVDVLMSAGSPVIFLCRPSKLRQRPFFLASNTLKIYAGLRLLEVETDCLHLVDSLLLSTCIRTIAQVVVNDIILCSQDI